MKNIYKTIQNLSFIFIIIFSPVSILSLYIFTEKTVFYITLFSVLLAIIFYNLNKPIGDIILKIKDNQAKSLLIFIVLLIPSFLFYWYEIRPAGIRIVCSQGKLGDIVYRVDKEAYESCIHRNGLK